MSEVEYKGIKIKGSKIFLLIPLLGSILGGAYGVFEGWKMFQDMSAKIDSYVAPDLSHFQEQLSVMEEKIISLDEQIQVKIDSIDTEFRTVNELVQAAAKDARTVRNDLRQDITVIENLITEVDKRSRANYTDVQTSIRNNESQIRSLISEAETRFDEKRNLIEQDSSRRAESFSKLLTDLEERFDTKLERALNNPLAGQ
tara:strand:+ start:1946 stop:2545 length:600 start_codon:yes stop_codon:yes gene_type:complete